MSLPVLITPNILNQMRTTLYGRNASLTFYTVTPAAGETALGSPILRDWYAQRKSRKGEHGLSGALTIWLAGAAPVDIDDIRDNAVVSIEINKQTRRYRVKEITEMQQIGSGWVLHCEPLSNTV